MSYMIPPPNMDITKVLEHLVGPCADDSQTDHNHNKCPRCLTIKMIEQRDPLMMKLLNRAMHELRTSR